MVRLQDMTSRILRVGCTLVASLLLLAAHAQQAPPPRPTVCNESGPPPLAGELWGGDFSVIAGSTTLTNDAYCLGPNETTVDLTFAQNNPASVGVFTVNVGYLPGVNDASDLINGYLPNNTFQFKEGYYWVAQNGINANNDTYHKCKLISIFKPQPVTADVKTCGGLITVSIPSAAEVPTNNHTSYEVVWGGISSTIVAPSTTNLPAEVSRLYTPTSPIIIRGLYRSTAGNNICPSQFLAINPEPENIIYINRLAKLANETDYELSFRGFVPNVQYRISYAEDDGSTTPTWIEDSEPFVNGNAIIQGLDPEKNYCFKIAYVNNCGIPRESNVVCSISLAADIVSDTDVNLQWNRPTQPSGILQQNDLQKDEDGCTTCYEEPTLSSFTATNYTYTNLVCSSIFRFQIFNRFTVNISGTPRDVEILSNEVRVDPASIPPPKPLFPAVATYPFDTGVEEVQFIISTDTPKASYNFYRSVNGMSPYTLVGSSPTNAFTDTNVDPNNEFYCYKYTYLDDCGNESEQSDPYCTIQLGSNAAGQLDWTPFEIPNISSSGQVTYNIEFIDVNGNTRVVSTTSNLQESVEAIIASTNEPSASFRVLATQGVTLDNGLPFLFTSRSNVYTFNLPSAAFIPSAFTPNGDGINDTFKPASRFVMSGSMIIYDRWGSIIFETSDLNIGWDGTEISGSRLAPVGTYTYKIQTVDDKGKQSFYAGSVTLIR